MEVSLTDEELAAICEMLKEREDDLAEREPEGENLKDVRKLFQRLHTLRTAK